MESVWAVCVCGGGRYWRWGLGSPQGHQSSPLHPNLEFNNLLPPGIESPRARLLREDTTHKGGRDRTPSHHPKHHTRRGAESDRKKIKADTRGRLHPFLRRFRQTPWMQLIALDWCWEITANTDIPTQWDSHSHRAAININESHSHCLASNNHTVIY